MNLHLTARIAAAVVFSAAGSAHAQTQLTPAAAAAGNITPGDAPSSPITITKRGLYRFGADLIVPRGMNAIKVMVENVKIDLNGNATVSGDRACTQPQTAWTVTCNAFSVPQNYGIRGLSGLVVRNGRARGFSTCIFFDGGCRMEDLIMRHNHYGIWQSPSLTPANSMAGVHIARVVSGFNCSGGMTLWNGYV